MGLGGVLSLLLMFAAVQSWAGVSKVTQWTTEGSIEGRSWNNIEFFKNIPYAKPPVGELRWKAPRPLSKRTQTLKFNNQDILCAQDGSPFGTNKREEIREPIGQEDCLYLHIWKPKGKKKRPVFVWYHGGSNYFGYASDPLYNGANLAQALDAVVVTANYRLGHFAGLVHPALESKGDHSKEDKSGNTITLDNLAALKWVRRNAKFFGGDANNITIGGESAGCFNVWGLILSPLAKGKFKRAYCMSGIPNNYPMVAAKDKTKNFIENALVLRGEAYNLKLAKNVRRRMTDTEVKTLLYSLTLEEILSIRNPSIPVHHISDGYVLPRGSVVGLLSNKVNKVSLMTGTTALEASYYYLVGYLNLSYNRFWDLVTTPEGAHRLKDFVRSSEYKDFIKDSKAATKVFSEVVDYSLHMAQLRLKDIYRLRFEWTAETPLWRDAFGSSHAFELPFLFRNFRFAEQHFLSFLETDLLGQYSQDLADEYTVRVKGFVHKGDPNFFIEADQIEWKTWSSLPGIRPVNMVFANDGLKTRYEFPNLLVGLDMFRVASSILRVQD